MQHSTIAAIATAPGQGGIAVVRLSGPESYLVAERVFIPANPQKTVAGAKGYTALFGRFCQAGECFDEGWPSFSGHPTAIPAKMWWNCPAPGAMPSPAVWWKPASRPGRPPLDRGNTPAGPC